MQYLGGKAKLAKHLVSAIAEAEPDITTIAEPFCGGAWMTTELAKHYQVVASDAHEDLILMWQAVMDGWTPPDTVSEDLYQRAKIMDASPLRGFVGFACSFGGKWFGGYARNRTGYNYAAAAQRSVLKKKVVMNNHVSFVCADYKEAYVESSDAVYCDPPYAGTTGYSVKAFDHEEFWAVMDSWTTNVPVFVSEKTAPDGWTCVWEKDYTRSLRATNSTSYTEKLFYKPKLDTL